MGAAGASMAKSGATLKSVWKGNAIVEPVAVSNATKKVLSSCKNTIQERILHDNRGMVDLNVFRKSGKTSIQPYEVTTYDDFRARSVVGDGLEGHEVWQHANLNENGYATTRLSSEASKNNIVIALPHGVHVDVNKAQYSLNARSQNPLDNIKANADILYNHDKIPNSQVDKALEQAIQHYNSIKK